MTLNLGALDKETVAKYLAAAPLTFLSRSVSMLDMATTSLGGDALSQYCEQNESVSLRLVKDSGEAGEMTLRSGSDVTLSEPGYTIVNLILEKLFFKGFPIYSYDGQGETYIRDYTNSIGNAMRKSLDGYIYNKYRTWDLASSGALNIADHPPIAVTWKENSSGVLQGFSREHLLYAGKILDKAEVPSTNRKARIGVNAKTQFLSDATAITGFAGALASSNPGTQLLVTGMPVEQEIERDGFMVKGSNAVSGQSAVADLGDGVAFEPIGAAVADTTVFFNGHMATSTPLGAVRLTITQTANLAAGVAVGKIARIGAQNAAAVAYGVILRVDAANKYVWLVPYDSQGNVVAPAAITGDLSVPAISEVAIAGHNEAVAYATRLKRPPTQGSGAVSASMFDSRLGLISQIWMGDFNIRQLKEDLMQTILIGAKNTDFRKACVLISN